MDVTGEQITQSPEHLEQLRALVHDAETLQRAGYVVGQLSANDLARKRRCGRCHRSLKREALKHTLADNSVSPQSLMRQPEQALLPTSVNTKTNTNTNTNNKTRTKTVLDYACRFHPGTYSQRAWSCCNKPLFTKPCHGEDFHIPLQYAPGELERDWRYYSTPDTPAQPGAPLAVAVDCEMGTAASGDTELIRVSVVDYFTGAVLLDRLVYPAVAMAHYNTAFSGVTRAAMESARRSRTCLFGRNKARKAVYDVIGPDTIVLGHGGHGDLTALRWIHPWVVDTLIVEQAKRAAEELAAEITRAEKAAAQDDQEEPEEPEDVKPAPTGGLSLKVLARKRLGREIQIKGQGHDSVEDALATRDLVHWHVREALQLAHGPLVSV